MGNFTFSKTEIDGVYMIMPKVHRDQRGYFMETYNQTDFEKAGLFYTFVQDNQSSSRRGVLRGLHFQKTFPQAKLVRVVSGEVFDVAVDLRKDSPSYGRWIGVFLSDKNQKQLLIPRGFAHGFMVISEYAEFTYKCDEFYHPEDEGGLPYCDPTIGIKWPEVGEVIVNEKDKHYPTLKASGIVFGGNKP